MAEISRKIDSILECFLISIGPFYFGKCKIFNDEKYESIETHHPKYPDKVLLVIHRPSSTIPKVQTLKPQILNQNLFPFICLQAQHIHHIKLLAK